MSNEPQFDAKIRGGKLTKKVKTQLVGPSYRVDAQLNGFNISSIVDSGSVVSLVSENFVINVLGLKVEPFSTLTSSEQVNNVFYTANGEELDYVGYVNVELHLPSVAEIFDALLLVIPSNSNEQDHLLLGNNILSLLLNKVINDPVLSEAVSMIGKFTTFNTVKNVVKKVVLKENSMNICKTKMRVLPAPFQRTVVLTPTIDAESIGGVMFLDTCVEIPKNSSKVDILYKVCNVNNGSVHIKQNLPIYDVHEGTIIKEEGKGLKNETISDEDFLKLFNFETEKFSSDHMNKIEHLLLKYKDLFALNAHQLGTLKGKEYEYKIELTDAVPVKQRYRKIHPRYYDRLQQQLKTMLEANIITECTSPWSSPLTIVEKSDGDIRLCVDFRSVNSKCKRDAKPIPRIDETLSTLHGNTYFSTTDLLSGYWQVPLHPDSKDITAFTAGSEKLYRFERVPFGHTGSGAHFQRCMEDVLQNLLYKHCLIYLDDVCIMSKDFDSHLTSIELVFRRLLDAGLKLKPKKCNLFKQELKFLGHIVSGEGIKCDPDKTNVIQEWKRPETTRETRSFLGLVGYYRKFITNFSVRASPLTDLLKGKKVKRGDSKKFVPVPFLWTTECEESFIDLKSTLINDICLNFPDFDKDYILEIDASRGGYGAVLSQEVDGKRKPIAFGSKRTSLAESNYPAHKLEFAALRWAVTQKFREYLYHSFADVYTDSNPVVYILQKLDIDAVTQRWIADLAKFDFKIHYRTGKSNTAADSLSRMYSPEQMTHNDVKKWVHGISNEVDSNTVKTILSALSLDDNRKDHIIVKKIQGGEDTYEEDVLDKVDLIIDNNGLIDIRKLQKEDIDIQYIINNVVGNNNIGLADIRDKSRVIKSLWRKRKRLHTEDGLLYKSCEDNCRGVISKQLVINNSCINELIDLYHVKQGHLGRQRTEAIISDRFYWPRMSADIEYQIKNCRSCLQRKTLPSNNKAEMYHRMESKYPMDIVSLDHLTIDTNNNTKVLTIIDEFSKFLFIVPVRKENSTVTADTISKQVFLKYGFPNVIHTDNSTSFCNRVVKKLLTETGVKHTFSTPYHSQGNAIVERSNSVILNMMGTLKPAEKRNWKKHCDFLSYAYNTTIHSATNMTPYFLMFGRHPRLIGDAILNISLNHDNFQTTEKFSDNLRKAYKLCIERLKQQRVKYKKFYDNKLNRNLNTLKEKDIVLIRNERMTNKIDDRWMSTPFIIIDQPDNNIPVYRVKELESDVVKTKHRNQLLPIFRTDDIINKPRRAKLKKKTSTETLLRRPDVLSENEEDESSDQFIIVNRNIINDPISSDHSIGQSSPRHDDIDITLSDSSLDNILNDQNNDDIEDDINSIDSINNDIFSDGEDIIKSRFGRKIKPPNRYSP